MSRLGSNLVCCVLSLTFHNPYNSYFPLRHLLNHRTLPTCGWHSCSILGKARVQISTRTPTILRFFVDLLSLFKQKFNEATIASLHVGVTE